MRTSLANYYRPRSFDTVIGQEHITDILQAKIRNEKQTHHNYLFFGPRGTGKTTTARILAKALNANNFDEKGNPAQDDANVKAIDDGTTLDYVEIDAASHTGVDNIREEILDKVPYPPTMLKKKVYVIDEVHMLSKGAFNALLKTIEEPRDNVVFILATTEVHKIPDTIISRCQVFNFKKVPADKMVTHLENIANKEKMQYTQEALQLIATMSEGCVRDAVKYLDQVSILGEVNADHVTKFLGVASDAVIEKFIGLLKENNRSDVFIYVDTLHEQGIDLHNFAKQVLVYINHHLMEDTDFLIRVSEVFSEIMSTIRYYPYPVIVYKIACNKLFISDTQPISTNQQHAEKSVTVSGVNTTNSIQTSTNASKNTDHSAENGKNNNAATEQDTRKQSSDASSQQPETSNQGVDETTTETEKIKLQLVEKINKPSLQKNISEHLIIDRIENNDMYVIIINTMTHMIVDKEDTKKYLEGLLHDICNRPISIHVTFEKKEDYFQKRLTAS